MFPTDKIIIKVYTKEDCELCQPFIKSVQSVCKKNKWKDAVSLTLIDINSDKDIFKEYQIKIPACTINDRLAFKYEINELNFEKRLLQEIK